MKNHDLHEDLIISILSKLPVKSLLRFKCICKSWYDLIKSRSFIEMHLNRSHYTTKDDKDYLVSLAYDNEIARNLISFISYATFTFSLNLSVENLNLTHKRVTLLGSCNGLFFLQTNYKVCYLMNPATRECKEVATEPKLAHAIDFSYGFGFDPKTDDYKLVRVTIPLPGVTNKADVFSLRNNSWRLNVGSVEEGVKLFEYVSRAVVKNVIHWLCGTLKEEIGYYHVGIAGFDLVDEVFKDIIGVPENLKSRKYINFDKYRCCVVKDCLSMAAMFQDDYGIELWVMKEYGVEGSWIKQYRLDLSHVFKDPNGFILPFEIGFRGEPVLGERGKGKRLLVLRPSSGEDFEIVFDRRDAGFGYSFANYRESLVQIDRD